MTFLSRSNVPAARLVSIASRHSDWSGGKAVSAPVDIFLGSCQPDKMDIPSLLLVRPIAFRLLFLPTIQEL